MRTALLFLTTLVILATASSVDAKIAWQTNLRAAHAQAQSEGKLLLLHFYTDNCSWCDKLEKGSFQNQQVDDSISRNFVPVKVHANSSPKLAEMFKVIKFPTDVVVSTDGKTLAHTVSPQDPSRYIAMLTSTLPALSATKIAKAPAPNAALNVIGTKAQLAASKQTASAKATPNGAVAAAKTPPSPAETDSTTVSSSSFDLPALEKADLSFPEQTISRNSFVTDADDIAAMADDKLAIAALETKPETPATSKTRSEQKTAASSTSETELAMQGFCPVTVINEDRWVEGSPEFGVIHLGKLYLFTDAGKMQKFLADPIPYTPVLNEIDVVRFFEERIIVPGKREWGLKDPIHNRMFFFADEAAMDHFYNEYERYSDAAVEVMKKVVKEANPDA